VEDKVKELIEEMKKYMDEAKKGNSPLASGVVAATACWINRLEDILNQ
jgi:hypothetical protein